MDDRADNHTVWTEGDPVEPVTAENPLVGLETDVLRNWLDNSPRLRKAYSANPANRSDIDNAVRLSVANALDQELVLRAEGMSQAEAESFTRPDMWTPPRWPTTTSTRRRRRL